MPHLSPMSWMIMILLLWSLLMTISSMYWWSKPLSFMSSTKILHSNPNLFWSW